ncbi:ABC transporter permease [Nocardioides zeae]|uniref:ABC transporter permease n=1 Tax=Nocardioides imazamoxiresistens TaxID=3231893 RepID=A0ABU3PV80_9ACTN|nr:ABC transporter permease [Nocardioides zeae]MDT9593120.1 ABC transporter permease [Nocardioides zeae]
MSTSTPTTTERPERPERPEVTSDPRRVAGFGGVRLVIRRELATKLVTGAFFFSTFLFGLMAFAGPFVTGSGGDDDLTLGHSAATSGLADGVAEVAERGEGAGVSLREVADRDEATALLADGDVDAVVLEQDGALTVLVEDDLAPTLGTYLSSVAGDEALLDAATEAGVDPSVLAEAAAGAALQVEQVGEAFPIGDAMLGLSVGAIGLALVLLWGIPLATDVMQEKVSRVVEILLSSVRPWQLLAGKVLATTVIALVQLSVVLVGTGLAMAIRGSLPSLESLNWTVLGVGVVCLVLSIVTCSTLMAGLAARVERQEELSSVLQPAFAVVLLPIVAAVYLTFSFTDSIWFDVASLVPFFNTFALPARLAVETVPVWQVALSLAVAAGTAVAAFAVGGRVYGGAVLRAGGRVSLLEALRSR